MQQDFLFSVDGNFIIISAYTLAEAKSLAPPQAVFLGQINKKSIINL